MFICLYRYTDPSHLRPYGAESEFTDPLGHPTHALRR